MEAQTTAHFADAVIVVIYMLVSFGLGIFGHKVLRTKKDAEEGYFLAGRKVPGWLNGVSMAATYVNADVAPAYCGMAAVVGLSVSWFYLSRFGVGLLIAAMLFAVRWRQLGISTGPEFFALRFSGGGARFVRVYTSLFGVFCGIVPWTGAGLLGVHKICAPVFGIDSKATTLIIILPVLLAYIWASGFAGVLVTDAMQSLVILGANIMLAILVLVAFHGPVGLAHAVQAALPASAGDVLSTIPVAGHRVFGPLAVLCWLIVPTIGIGGGVLIEGQRIFSCKNTREAAKMGIWSEIGLFLMLLLLTLPVLGVLVNHPQLYGAEPSAREEAYGLLLKDFLPAGFLGIAISALLASLMSTLSGHFNYSAQTLVNDVYRPLIAEPSQRQALWIGRLMMLVVMACSVVVVYNADSLIGIAVLIMGLFGSSAAFSWAQWWWWRVNIRSWAAATIAGPVVYFTLGFALRHWGWWQGQLSSGESAAETMAMLQAVIAMACTTTIWLAVTLLTAPEDMELLKRFYRRARPMGAWGPVIRAIEQEDGQPLPRRQHLILGGLLASLLGFGWIALGVLAISSFYVGRYGLALGQVGGSIALAFVFKRAFGWHVGRLERDDIAAPPGDENLEIEDIGTTERLAVDV